MLKYLNIIIHLASSGDVDVIIESFDSDRNSGGYGQHLLMRLIELLSTSGFLTDHLRYHNLYII